MAFQWNFNAARWVVEGLAEWCEDGFATGLRADPAWRRLVSSGFAAYRKRTLGDDDAGLGFYDESVQAANYACSAAVFAFVEQRDGRAACFRLARKVYESTAEEGVPAATGGSLPRLFDQVQRWAEAL